MLPRQTRYLGSSVKLEHPKSRAEGARGWVAQFKLRIEDTDAERHDEDAAKAIVQGMEWLGVKHDGNIVRQSANKVKRGASRPKQ
jgi:hypothetical protein